MSHRRLEVTKNVTDRFEKKEIKANKGDCVIQNFDLLHESGKNISEKVFD